MNIIFFPVFGNKSARQLVGGWLWDLKMFVAFWKCFFEHFQIWFQRFTACHFAKFRVNFVLTLLLKWFIQFTVNGLTIWCTVYSDYLSNAMISIFLLIEYKWTWLSVGDDKLTDTCWESRSHTHSGVYEETQLIVVCVCIQRNSLSDVIKSWLYYQCNVNDCKDVTSNKDLSEMELWLFRIFSNIYSNAERLMSNFQLL